MVPQIFLWDLCFPKKIYVHLLMNRLWNETIDESFTLSKIMNGPTRVIFSAHFIFWYRFFVCTYKKLFWTPDLSVSERWLSNKCLSQKSTADRSTKFLEPFLSFFFWSFSFQRKGSLSYRGILMYLFFGSAFNYFFDKSFPVLVQLFLKGVSNL